MLKSLQEMEKPESRLHPSIRPPPEVKGMKDLNREAFRRKVELPAIRVDRKKMDNLKSLWAPLCLRIPRFKSVVSLGDSDAQKKSHALIILDPYKFQDFKLNVQKKQQLKDLCLDVDNLEKYEAEITYENWTAQEIFKAVIAEDSISSFAQIGHIVHLNLRSQHDDFKYLIGQVLLDKIISAKTVINKTNEIDNTYRNFKMELLAGEDNYETTVKENKCRLQMDFSKVYWNSRLGKEHEAVVQEVALQSVVFDMFAGIGPFAIPLAKHNSCQVFANDLNPESCRWLNKNITLNKVHTDKISTSNLDGREFVKTKVKVELKRHLRLMKAKQDRDSGKDDALITDENEDVEMYIPPNSFALIMNLPGLAVEFLDVFPSLLSDLPAELTDTRLVSEVCPIVYCYTFIPKLADHERQLRSRVEGVLGYSITGEFSVKNVRDVSPNKLMYRIKFQLPPEVFLGLNSSLSDTQATSSHDLHAEFSSGPEAKKQKLSN